MNDAVHEASALLLRLIFSRNRASAVEHVDAVSEFADHPYVVLAKLAPAKAYSRQLFRLHPLLDSASTWLLTAQICAAHLGRSGKI